jgi:hypothetical protein
MIGFLMDNWGLVESDILAHYREPAGTLGLTTLTARLAALPPSTVTKRLLADLFEDTAAVDDPLTTFNQIRGIAPRRVANWRDL